MNYGYSSDETIVSGSNNLKFGLNNKTIIDELSYHEEDNNEYLKLILDVNGTKVQIRKYKVERVYVGDKTITDPKNEEFIKAELELSAWVVHILGCFYEKEVLKNILNKDFNSFRDYGKTVQSLITDEHKQIKLDVFLQYQWKINPNANKTFLSIPSKMKYGKWLCKHIEGDFEEKRTDKGLYYEDKETGKKHIFYRNAWFMDSNFAKLQTEDNDNVESFPKTENSNTEDFQERTPEW